MEEEAREERVSIERADEGDIRRLDNDEVTIKNEEVVPVMSDESPHAKHAPAKSIFLLTLSTIIPMKIPANAYETL